MHTLTTLVASLPTESVVPTAQAADGAIALVAPLLVALPLLSAALLLLTGRRSDRWGHWLGVLASAASFVVAAVVFLAAGILIRVRNEDDRNAR